MLMGWYDHFKLEHWSYENLVPGGHPERDTYPPAASSGVYRVNDVIASPGHIADFYRGPYEASGDDAPGPHHSFDCLADFMGTSQDSVGNINGSTKCHWHGSR